MESYQALSRQTFLLILQLFVDLATLLSSNFPPYHNETTLFSGNETKTNLMEMRRSLLEMMEKRAKDEVALYMSNKPEDKKKTARDQLTKGISEAERRGKRLKEEQKIVKENVTDNSKQVQMWSNLEKLLECKKKCFENVQQSEGDNIIHQAGTETLIL